MRIRTIKPEFFRDPDTTGRWPADLKMFYVGMWCVADDAGRFAWDEDLIGSDLFPFDRKADVGKLLARLVEAGVVVTYTVDGRKYGFLKNFSAHQKINRPTPSRLPDPSSGITEPAVSHHGGLTAGKERKGSGIRDQGGDEPSSPPSPVVAVLPCVGQGDTEYPVTQAEVDAWTPAYPGIDVRAEVLKAKVWLEANPSRRKTHAGIPRFLVSWLNRAQDGAKGRPGDAPKDIRVGSAPAESHESFKARGGGVQSW
jgi:hypothetical protein